MSPKVDIKHKEERKNQILTAAFTCFYKLGYQQATMRDICKEAELSTGAVYSYFPSKKDIVYALVAYGESTNEEFFYQLDSDLNPLEKIKKAMVDYFAMFDKKNALPGMKVDHHLKEAALQDRDILALVQKSVENRLLSIEKLLHDAKSQKLVDESMNVRATAQILLSILGGSISQKLFIPKMDMKSYSKEAEAWIDSALQNTQNQSNSHE